MVRYVSVRNSLNGIIEMSEEEKYQIDLRWVRVYTDMLRSGFFDNVDGSSAILYLIIKSYLGFSTGDAKCSIEEISKETGLSERQVIRCFNVLEKAGCISKKRTGKHNVYTINEKIRIKDSDGNTCAIASWKHVPNLEKDIAAALNHAVSIGDLNLPGDKSIHFHIHINQLNVANDESTQLIGDHNAQIKLSTAITESLEKLPDEMKGKVLAIKNSIDKKK